jgi:hypothetical protein
MESKSTYMNVSKLISGVFDIPLILTANISNGERQREEEKFRFSVQVLFLRPTNIWMPKGTHEFYFNR